MAEMAKEMKWWQKRLGGIGPWPVEQVATHDRAHFDEALAYVECATWGKDIFSGVENAPIVFWTEGHIPQEYQGKNGDQLLVQHKILPIGIGGGILDEHGIDSPTCAHLAAEILGVYNNSEMQKILQFCRRVDEDGHSMPFDIHSLLNDFWDDCENEEDLSEAFDWAVDGIRAFIRGQIRFFKCQSEFGKNGRIIKGPLGIAVVKSPNRKMNKWIRWRFGKEVGVIIQQCVSGNKVIFTSPHMNGLNMDDLVRVVRITELMKRKILLPSWQELEKPDACERCPWWHYNKKDKSQLLNGPLSAPDVEPSALSLNEIAGAVALACTPLIDPCKNEKCLGRKCNKYMLGLKSCRAKRYEIYHKDV